MHKRLLNANYHGLIFLTKTDGDNQVPFILGNESYNCHYPSMDYEYESSYFGYLNGERKYESFYYLMNNYVKDSLKDLKDKYLKAKSKEYYDSLTPLVSVFSQLKDSYEDLKKQNKNIKYDKDPVKSFLRFSYIHPEIIQEFDIRFCHLNYSIKYDNPQNGVMGKLVTFEPRPIITYEDYAEFIDKFYQYKSKEIENLKLEEISDLEKDYQSLINDLNGLLAKYKEVGVVYSHLSIPKRLVNKEINNISKLDIDTFLKLEQNKIYWVKSIK